MTSIPACARAGAGGEVVAENLSALHDEFDPFEFRDVVRGIACDGNQIGAYLPFSMDPTRSPQPMFSAATEVAERIACKGVIPYSTMVANSTASSP